MNKQNPLHRRFTLGITVLAATLWLGPAAAAPDLEAPYQPIEPTLADETITLTGHELTIEQLVRIARHGAKVRISPEARQRAAAAYGLLLQGGLEGMPIYGFTRGYGSQREVELFSGDPLAPENKKFLQQRWYQIFEDGAYGGYGPEVPREEITRAFMAARANNVTYEAVTPEFLDMLVALLNRRVTPVLQARGTNGDSDLWVVAIVYGTMLGKGDAYYRGERMPADQALEKAGLSPITVDEIGVFNGFYSSNAYSAGWAALVVDEGRRMLEWIDLLHAMVLNGMNSTIAPLALPVQTNRRHTWLNWNAARVLGMLRGSYLLEYHPDRIIQDPESLRAASIRQGSAWQAWSVLRDSVLMQINTSDHNPAVVVGLEPDDSWELATPWLMRYHVKGGKYSSKPGYILSNANWDPYPLANDVEYFLNALQNLGVVVAQRMQRFSDPYFTVLDADEFLERNQESLPAGGYIPRGSGSAAAGLWQDVQNVSKPISPEGFSVGLHAVADIQAQTRLKIHNLNLALEHMYDLIGQELMTAAFWMDLRKLQDPDRTFGAAPTAAWQAFREVVPFRYGAGERPTQPIGRLAARFLRETPASTFYPDGPPLPGGHGNIPLAQEAVAD